MASRGVVPKRGHGTGEPRHGDGERSGDGRIDDGVRAAIPGCRCMRGVIEVPIGGIRGSGTSRNDLAGRVGRKGPPVELIEKTRCVPHLLGPCRVQHGRP